METILRHCYVMSPKEFKDASDQGDDVFYCEYEYDIHWHNFKRLADIDDEPEVHVLKLGYRLFIVGVQDSGAPFWQSRSEPHPALLLQTKEDPGDEPYNAGNDYVSDSDEDSEYDEEEEPTKCSSARTHQSHALAAVPTIPRPPPPLARLLSGSVALHALLK